MTVARYGLLYAMVYTTEYVDWIFTARQQLSRSCYAERCILL